MANINDTLEMIKQWTCFVFNNEKKFLKEFYPYDNIEIFNVSFSWQKCHLVLEDTHTGERINKYLPVQDVLYWMEQEMNNETDN